MDANSWNALIAALPGVSLLQTWQWGEVRRRLGWKPYHLVWKDAHGRPAASALTLQRSLRLGGLRLPLSVMYVPHGPQLDWSDSMLTTRVLHELAEFAHRQGAIFLKIDPDVRRAVGLPGAPDEQTDPFGEAAARLLQDAGFFYSREQVQFPNTVLVDLRPSLDEQKTRYNIRLAARKGVRVRQAGEADYPLLYRMYAETAARDGFVIRDQSYYTLVWGEFGRAGMACPLIATVEGEPAAGLALFHFAGKAWYLHGMSTGAHRQKMPNALLQWEAIQAAKALGCQEYDLWGAPDRFDESDPMWGVYRFKDGLGGQVVRKIGAWDLPLRPALYRLYTIILPQILELMRRRARRQVGQVIAGA